MYWHKVLAVALAVAWLCFAQMRLIDGDEGYLLYAANLVERGQATYRDFFFPQAPLLPYVLSVAAVPLGGVAWRSARLLSAVMACGILVASALGPKHDRSLAGWRVLLLGTCSLAFSWLTIGKTYCLSTLWLVVAYRCVSLRPKAQPTELAGAVWVFLSALAVGFATSTRLYCAIAMVPLLWTLQSTGRVNVRTMTVVAAGFASGIAPLAASALVAPDAAYYGLIEYHLDRTSMSVGEAWPQRWGVIRDLLGLSSGERPLGLQFDLLLVLAALGCWARWRERRVELTALPWAVSLSVVSLVPSPTFVQYFTMTTPFWVDLAAVGVLEGLARLKSRWRTASAALLALVYLALAAAEVDRHVITGKGVPGVGELGDVDQWRLDTVLRTQRFLQDCGPQAAAVSWPGYLVGTKTLAAFGTENHFGVAGASRVLDADRRRKLHLFNEREVKQGQADQAVPIVVLGNWLERARREARLPGYVAIVRRDGTAVWALPHACAVDAAQPSKRP